jgi:hypothetical protein
VFVACTGGGGNVADRGGHGVDAARPTRSVSERHVRRRGGEARHEAQRRTGGQRDRGQPCWHRSAQGDPSAASACRRVRIQPGRRSYRAFGIGCTERDQGAHLFFDSTRAVHLGRLASYNRIRHPKGFSFRFMAVLFMRWCERLLANTASAKPALLGRPNDALQRVRAHPASSEGDCERWCV